MNHVEYKEGAKVTARTVDSNVSRLPYNELLIHVQLQLVVILDPTADPDDILRANRSREKHYIFDYAFDQMATQVSNCLPCSCLYVDHFRTKSMKPQ